MAGCFRGQAAKCPETSRIPSGVTLFPYLIVREARHRRSPVPGPGLSGLETCQRGDDAFDNLDLLLDGHEARPRFRAVAQHECALLPSGLAQLANRRHDDLPLLEE